MKFALLLCTFGAALSALGCGRPAVPDPKLTLQRYAEALERGDASAVYSLLSSRSQRHYGPAQVRELVADNSQELARLARELEPDHYQMQAQALVRFTNGAVVQLGLENGRFGLDSGDGVLGRPRTPEQALADLQGALRRGSLVSLLHVLSQDTRAKLEADLGALIEGLAEPRSLDIDISGDTARVLTPNGHWVELRLEQDTWRIHDFR